LYPSAVGNPCRQVV